jgi:hypothetical protein
MITQKGNVLFVVLAAIALFAGLVMAMTRSDNTNSAAVLSQAEAKLHAASIMRFGSDVEQAVRRLTTIGGCDIEEVSFERAPFDGSDTDYVNPNSPTDKSCHVFHGSGGQVEYITFEDKWKSSQFTANDQYGDWYFSVVCLGVASAPNCNSTSETLRRGSLVLYAPIIKEEICRAINVSLNKGDIVPDDRNSLLRQNTYYQGDFSLNVPHIDFLAPYENKEAMSLCVSTNGEPGSGSFNYYSFLYLREDTFK